jgi:hypothetical protein
MPPPPPNVRTERLHVPVSRDAIRGRRSDLTPNDTMRQLAPSDDDAAQAVPEASRESRISERRSDHAPRLQHRLAAVYSVEL